MHLRIDVIFKVFTYNISHSLTYNQEKERLVKKRLLQLLVIAVTPLYLTGCSGFAINIGGSSSTSSDSGETETVPSDDDSTPSEDSSDADTDGEYSGSEDSSDDDSSSEDSSGDDSSSGDSSDDSSSGDSSDTGEETDDREVTDNGYYKQPSSYAGSASVDNLNLKTIKSGYSMVPMPSTGNSKILVVPVEYSDYKFTDGYQTMLQNAFFGKAENTDWESVSSYYYESSNGKLDIQGSVAPKVSLNMTLSEAKASSETTVSDNALESALTELAETMDLTEFDSDGDNYIDAVWLVNSAPYSSSYGITWAYTYWYAPTTKFDGMRASSYCWASISFLERYVTNTSLSYGCNADCHTMIHETGHLLGLDDYYSYDYNGDAPAGVLDMMDYNVGDHMEFSKYLLGWTEPTVLTEDYLTEVDNQITVNSSEIGENTAYLLPIQSEGKIEDFNNTPFDEYLIIEYYSPTSMNKKDSTNPYIGYIKEYSEPGIAVYHVNNRIGKITATSSGMTWDGCVYDKLGNKDYEPRWGQTYVYYPIYSNTASYCYDTSFSDSTANFYQGRLVSLLPQTGMKTTTSYWGSSSFLYAKGDTFMLSSGSYTDFVFEDGSKPLYGFKVTDTESTSATLTFAKN